MILKHLRRKPITPIDALNLYGCFRLSARIMELRADGHNIHTELVQKDGKRFAKYYFKK
jgi:uncharacterized small protein (DUF1192 family)